MRRVLIVEDESAIAEVLAELVAECGHQVELCARLHEAAASLAVRRPHLVIADIRLPDGSGLALVRWMGAAHPEVPAILMTAGLAPDVDEDANVHAVLTKPFAIEHFLEVVEAALGS